MTPSRALAAVAEAERGARASTAAAAAAALGEVIVDATMTLAAEMLREIS